MSKSGSSSLEENSYPREHDRLMPIANVIRIMRKMLPAHAKISDDAKEIFQEFVSEFISFITSEANDRCKQEQRKTITADNILWAMSKLGLEDYADVLTVYLHKYREIEGDHRASSRCDIQTKKEVVGSRVSSSFTANNIEMSSASPLCGPSEMEYFDEKLSAVKYDFFNGFQFK